MGEQATGSTVNAREALVLRAVRDFGGGTEEMVWNSAWRLTSTVPWPSPKGLPLSLRPYLVKLAKRGLLDREQQPSAGSYQPPTVEYTLTRLGEDALARREAEDGS